MQVNGSWTPTIVAFCCNWCSYAGADLSGTNRLSYPANVKIIRIPCSCRLNPMFILRAFQRGADGVMVEMHPDPLHARCDGAQALLPEELAALSQRLHAVREACR